MADGLQQTLQSCRVCPPRTSRGRFGAVAGRRLAGAAAQRLPSPFRGLRPSSGAARAATLRAA